MHLYDHFDTICEAARDLHVRQINSRVFKVLEIGTDEPSTAWAQAWKMLSSTTSSILNKLLDVLRNMGWEFLYTIKEVPNYLRSLLTIINDLLANPVGKKLDSLARLFYSTAKQFWTFLIQLVPSAASFLPEIETFGRIIREVGSQFASSVKFLLRGVAQIVSAVIDVYMRAIDMLSAFCSKFFNIINTIPTMGIQAFQELHEKSVQTILFSVLMIQNVTRWAATKTEDAKQYLEQYAGKLMKAHRSTHELIAKMDMEGALKTALTSLLQLESVQSLIKYINSFRIVVILKEIFGFIQRIVENISFTISSYVTTFVAGVVDKYMDIGLKFASEYGVEQKKMSQLTEACIELQKDSRVSPENKTILNRVTTKAQKTQKILESTQIMTVVETWDVARVLKDVFYGKEVPEKDLDAAVKAQTGFGIGQLTVMLTQMTNLMSMQLAVTFAQISPEQKTKVEGEIDDYMTLEQRRENLKVINDRIETLKREIDDIKKGTPYKVLTENRYENLNYTISRNKVVNAEYLEQKEILDKAIDQEAGISKKEEEIKKLEEEAKPLQLGYYQKTWKIRKEIGISFCVLAGMTLFWTAWTQRSKRSTEYFMGGRKILRKFSDAYNNDEFIRYQINQYLQTVSPDIDDPEAVVTGFYDFQNILPYRIRENQMPMSEIRNYARLLSKSTLSQPNHHLRSLPSSDVVVYGQTDVMNVANGLEYASSYSISVFKKAMEDFAEPSWIQKLWYGADYFAKGVGTKGADTQEKTSETQEHIASGHEPHVEQQLLYWETQLVGYQAYVHIVGLTLYTICAATVYFLNKEHTEAGQIVANAFIQIPIVYGEAKIKIVKNVYLIGMLRLSFLQPLIFAYKIAITIWPWLNPLYWLGKIGAIPRKLASLGSVTIQFTKTAVIFITEWGTWAITGLYHGAKGIFVSKQAVQTEHKKTIETEESQLDVINRKAADLIFKKEKVASAIPCDTCFDPTAFWATATAPHAFYCSHGCATIAHLAPQ